MIQAKPSVSLTLPGAFTQSPAILSRQEMAARRNGISPPQSIPPIAEAPRKNRGGRPKGSKNKKI